MFCTNNQKEIAIFFKRFLSMPNSKFGLFHTQGEA